MIINSSRSQLLEVNQKKNNIIRSFTKKFTFQHTIIEKLQSSCTQPSQQKGKKINMSSPVEGQSLKQSILQDFMIKNSSNIFTRSQQRSFSQIRPLSVMRCNSAYARIQMLKLNTRTKNADRIFSSISDIFQQKRPMTASEFKEKKQRIHILRIHGKSDFQSNRTKLF